MAIKFAFCLSIIMTIYLFYYATSELKKEYKATTSLNFILVIIMAFVFSGLAYIFI